LRYKVRLGSRDFLTKFALLDVEGICPIPQCIQSLTRRHQLVAYCFSLPAIPIELIVLNQGSVDDDIGFAQTSVVRRYYFALVLDALANYKAQRIS
jgi:hypothetical protein